jgi:hypothetical protein
MEKDVSASEEITATKEKLILNEQTHFERVLVGCPAEGFLASTPPSAL